MPIIYGIAALAVAANGFDQAGIDPQVDKQYAIVKQNEQPVAQSTTNQNSTLAPTVDSQATGGTISFSTCPANTSFGITIDFQGSVPGFQAGATTAQGNSIPPTPPAVATTPGLPGQISIQSGPAPSIAYALSGQARPAPMMTRIYGGDNLRSLKGMDRKVSVKFNNATAADVLKWLGKQNVNFVANVDSLPKTKITMNVANVPLHEALESVAESLGGSWQIKGSTLIFRNSFFGSLGSMGGTYAVPAPRMNMQGWQNASPFMKLKGMPDGELFKFDDNQLKMLKGLDGRTFDFKFDEKALKDMKGFDGKLFKFDENQLKAFKDMKGFDGKAFTFKKIDVKKFLNSLTKEQKELQKKQGFLKASDLTEEQRKMLFDGPKAELPTDFTMMLNQDGEKIVIKN